MCFNNHGLKNLHQWNWDGDVIIHESIVPASRWVVGYNQKYEYNIDIREFLITDKNEIIRTCLNKDFKDYILKIKGNPDLFTARTPGSFDYRADIVAAFVSENVKYISKLAKDPWQFPDETLFVREGDCEDRAFLIASLLLGSGISSFNIRVAIGKVHTESKGRKIRYDHVWVMYKAESGHWQLIEPLNIRGTSSGTQETQEKLKPIANERIIAEYTPFFLFNDEHLWAVPEMSHPASFTNHVKFRNKWKKWNPKFAGEVHQSIINVALQSLPPDQHVVIDALNRRFSRAIGGIAGPIVDDIDRDIKGYSPIDHFDNGFIVEGWANVKEKLIAFNQNNDNLESFFSAAHAIADFYAHTSYVHFKSIGTSPGNAIPLFNPDEQLSFTPNYQHNDFNLDSGKFTVNKFYWNNQNRTPARQWDGKLISGRYAQKKDTQPGLQNLLIEGLTNIPDKLLKEQDFFTRGALPHHNEIAVDDEKLDVKRHKLYTDPTVYQNQFNWRKKCAVEHVKKAFFDNWHRS